MPARPAQALSDVARRACSSVGSSPSPPSRARPWALAVASGVAAAASSGPWVVVACVALAVCVVDATIIDLPHRRVLGAVIGAVDVQVLLRMPHGRLVMNALATCGRRRLHRVVGP